MSYPLSDWLTLSCEQIANIGGKNIDTAVLYINGTRRWFRSQCEDWQNYGKLVEEAHRRVSQLCYEHGINTLIQPVLGYDLLTRGAGYLRMAVEALGSLVADDYRRWFVENEIQVCFYGNWRSALAETGHREIVGELSRLMKFTRTHGKRRLFIGLFADEGLKRIVDLAHCTCDDGEFLRAYYGAAVGPVNIVIGSGQPAIWDIPLLDINKANLYFMQAPTYFLAEARLREILHDHLYRRRNDDELQEDLDLDDWSDYAILGLGEDTPRGWLAT